MILYVPFLPTGGFTCSQSLILINSKYRGDAGLLAHERCHQEQMRRVGTLWFWWRYATHQRFRLRAEVEAYKVQIAHGANPDKMAEHLARGYCIGLGVPYAKQLLKENHGLPRQ